MYKGMQRLIIFGIVSMVLGPCQSEGVTATPMVPASVSPPSVSMTPRAEASSVAPEQTFTPSPATPTVFPDPTPALPSADGGPVPPGAIARLGIGSINAVDLSPDGQLLAVGTTAGMYVYDANTFERLWVQAIEAPVKGVAWSRDGSLVAVWFVQISIVVVYDGLTGRQQRYLEHSGHIGDVDWSPDGMHLVVGWSGHCICWQDMSRNPTRPRISVWDVAKSELVYTSETRYDDPGWAPPVYDVEWSPDGGTIAMVTDADSVESIGKAILLDAQTGVQTHVLEQEYLKSAAFSPDGTLLATWTTDTGTDAPRGSSNVWLWSVTTGELVYTLEGPGGYVYAVAWSPDGARLASGAAADDGAETIIWDVLTGTQLATASSESMDGVVLAIDWSPDGRYLASGIYEAGDTGGVMLWDTVEGHLEFASHEHQSLVEMVAWASNGQSFVTASSDAIFLRTPQQPEPLNSIRGIRSYIEIANMAWLSNASLVAVNSYETVVEWNVPGGQPIRVSDGVGVTWEPESLEFSPDGVLRAEIEFVPVKITEYLEHHVTRVIIKDANGAVLHTFDGPQADELLAKWSPDGKRLAVAGGLDNICKIDPFAEGWKENTVMVWDITTGELLHTFLGHTGRVFSLAWSPDGSMLASGSADGSVIVWDVSR